MMEPPLLVSLLFTFLVSLSVADDASVMNLIAKSLSPAPDGWSRSNPLSKWSGVKCDSSNRVTSIVLPNKFLSGKLPAEINQLTNLKTLNFQKNQLSGALPSLANLTRLQDVFLDNNAFTSISPGCFVGLTSLQTLSIGENSKLAPWNFPKDLTDSTNLVTLAASDVSLIGTIPDIFGSFQHLQSLRLSYNYLTGSLPSSFASSSIQNLLLNNQQNGTGLSGRLDVMGAMTQLTQVWIQNNQFSGPIPDLSKCTLLVDLQLRDNSLTGVIPPSLASLPDLRNVSLRNNKLQGPLPVFGKQVQLPPEAIANNNFCISKPGPCDPQVTTLLAIVGGMGYPDTLSDNWKGNDACKGWNFITCDSGGAVTQINFGKQQFNGTISPAIANLTSLTRLFLNDNGLTGSIPNSLTELPKLEVLDVTNNNLTGKIPQFSSKVAVKTGGNPFIGIEVSDSEGGGGSSASGKKSGKLSPGVIAGIVIGVLFLVGLLVFIIIIICKKRRQKEDLGLVQTTPRKVEKEGKVNDFAAVNNEQSSQSSAAASDIHVYDGGNVAIPIEVIREVTNNFSDDNILGRGGFGVVYKGELHDGTQIAVKRMESSIVSTKGMGEFQAEIAVLTKVRHRHLVALHGFCVNGNERLLVYEYMPQGTLGQHLYECNDMFPPLTWKQRVTIALDVARGVEYLHSLAQQSFIHRDLKPSNILLGADMRAKVSDFGLVKNAPDGKYSVETRLAGTFGYLAPEYAATGRVTTKVDVFAFGVVLMEMITARKALDENLPEEQCHLVSWFRRVLTSRENIRHALDSSLDPDQETFESICKVAELAGHCTAREPYQRPDMGHAVNVLAPLVEQWKPACDDEENDSFGIDLHMSLPQVLQRWQASEGNSSNLYDSRSHSTYSQSFQE